MAYHSIILPNWYFYAFSDLYYDVVHAPCFKGDTKDVGRDKFIFYFSAEKEEVDKINKVVLKMARELGFEFKMYS